MKRMLTRRAFLGALLTAPTWATTAPVGAASATPATARPRVAALDWSLASTALGLGVAPVGVAETALYRVWVGTPVLPPGTAELGLRLQPGLEGLLALKPDLILINALNEPARARLEEIAPVFADTTYTAAHAPLARNMGVVRELAARLGRPAAGEALIGEAEKVFDLAARRLADDAGRPLLPVSLVDGRHLTVYGAGSLFGDVLGRLGLPCAETPSTGPWGATLMTMADLGRAPPVDLLVMDPVPAEAVPMLSADGLLTRLLALRGGRLYRLPSAWPYGGLDAGARFATLVTNALTGSAPA